MKPLLFLVLFCFSLAAQESKPTEKPLQFEEIYSLIKTNLTDVSPEELSKNAALGLIREFGTRVQLVTTNDSGPVTGTDLLGRRAMYNDRFGYIQVRTVTAGLPGEFQKAVQQLGGSNELKGLVIDLRYAKGMNYEAAAAVADTFAKGGQSLLNLGGKEIRSTDKSKPLEIPLAALVNSETSGAAEALAAALRETAVALVVGAPTAGRAQLFETFTLSTGQKVRIGKTVIEAGDHKPISSKGVTPDISVTVAPATEKVWYEDPYRTLSIAANTGSRTNDVANSTNRARRFNEAELVRRHREGADTDLLDENAPIADRPVIMDPALARALDFLKGIAVLQQHRPL